ncbi:PEGA domain-containing protein [Vibrio maritimus]|uniref:PEGA domain-containing protein n=1 Tax=Vibrio maritimus TaxID=990268 RepID=UPI003736DC90
MRLSIFTILLLVGCSSSRDITYNVDSSPRGAAIDVNGVFIGETPTSVNFTCSKEWVGVMRSADGWSVKGAGPYNVTAFPPESSQGDSQTKIIRPCQWKGSSSPRLMFDMTLKNVSPIQRFETKNLSQKPSNKMDTLELLKALKEDGVITEAEYKERARKLL